jgi:hypothetical protein
MMMACYADVEAEVRGARHRGDYTMWWMWAAMAYQGVRRLGEQYWKSAAGCDGRLRNPSLCAALSAVLAEDMWLSLHRGPGTNQTWEAIRAAKDMPIPSGFDLADAIWDKFGDAALEVVSRLAGFSEWQQSALEAVLSKETNVERFMRLNQAFGRAHVAWGVSKAIAWARETAVDLSCIVNDVYEIGTMLPDVQQHVLLEFFDLKRGVHEDTIRRLLRFFFGRILQSDLVMALEKAGLTSEATQLRTKFRDYWQ